MNVFPADKKSCVSLILFYELHHNHTHNQIMVLHSGNMFIFVLTAPLRSTIIKNRGNKVKQIKVVDSGLCLIRHSIHIFLKVYVKLKFLLIKMQCLNDILLVLFVLGIFFLILLNVAL